MEKIDFPKEYRYIGAFLSIRCNLSCSYCINDIDTETSMNRRDFDELPGEQWINFFDRLSFDPENEVPITFSGGEPSLHRDFLEIIEGVSPERNINLLTNLVWS